MPEKKFEIRTSRGFVGHDQRYYLQASTLHGMQSMRTMRRDFHEGPK